MILNLTTHILKQFFRETVWNSMHGKTKKELSIYINRLPGKIIKKPLTSVLLVKIKVTIKVQRSVKDLGELHQKNGEIPIQTSSTYRGNGPRAIKWWREEKQGESWSLEQWIMLEYWMHLHKSQGLMSGDTEEKEREIKKNKLVDRLIEKEDVENNMTDERGNERKRERCCVIHQTLANLLWCLCINVELHGRFSPLIHTCCIIVSLCVTDWVAGGR